MSAPPADRRAERVGIDWDGRHVHIECARVGVEDPHAPTMLFLHEGLGSVAMWKAFPARLCESAGLWGKAQSYLEASLAVQPSQAAHLELARLFDRIGKAEDADRHYRAASDPGVTA